MKRTVAITVYLTEPEHKLLTLIKKKEGIPIASRMRQLILKHARAEYELLRAK